MCEEKHLDLGKKFVNHPTKFCIEFENPSQLRANYRLQASDEKLSAFKFAAVQPCGVMEPNSRISVEIDLIVHQIGFISFPVFTFLAGLVEPLVVNVDVQADGPNLIVTPQELRLGSVAVLEHHLSTVHISNQSDIAAEMMFRMQEGSSVFMCNLTHLTIQPWQEAEIQIDTYLDDAVKFADVVDITLSSKTSYQIPISAHGKGFTIRFDPKIKEVAFGNVFSDRLCTKSFSFLNKGRRTETIHWMLDEKKMATKLSELGQAIFQVTPNRFQLKPGQQQEVNVTGFSNRAGLIKEHYICYEMFERDPNKKILMEAQFSADFVQPLLTIEPTSLHFTTEHVSDREFHTSVKQVLLKNTSSLPLDLIVKAQKPYRILDENEFELSTGSERVLSIEYDSSYLAKRISSENESRVMIKYLNHPQRDYIELSSESFFPNLTFAKRSLDFPCVPRWTEERQSLTVENTSQIACQFSWSISETIAPCNSEDEGIELSAFDLRPLSGVILPGEIITIESIFTGPEHGTYNATAVCDVVGGPKYSVELNAEVQPIFYKISSSDIRFPPSSLQQIQSESILLENPGRVAFNYDFTTSLDSCLARQILLSPASGRVEAGQNVKVNIRFCTAYPGETVHNLFLNVGHLKPELIYVRGSGIHSDLHIELPREADDKLEQVVARLKAADAAFDTFGVTAEAIFIGDQNKASLRDQELLHPITNKGKYFGSSILLQSISQAGRGFMDKKSQLNIPSLMTISAPAYICDFGVVTSNVLRKRSVRIENKGASPVTLQLDKASLAGTGFRFGPDDTKIENIQIAAQQAVDLSINYNSKFVSEEVSGQQERILPLQIFNGHQITIILKARLVVPQLSLSSTLLEMEDVFIGSRKTLICMLSNTSSVGCNWSTDSADSNKSRLDPTIGIVDYTISPSSGHIEANTQIAIQVMFTPSTERSLDSHIIFKTPARNQGKALTLKVRGTGIRPALEVTPPSLALSPVQPCTETGEAVFELRNPNDFAIEVFSVDFDTQFTTEAEFLRRNAKESQSEYLYRRIDRSASPDAAAEGIDTLGEELNRTKLEDSEATPFAIILHGPPYTKLKEIANELSHLYALPIVEMRDLVPAVDLISQDVCISASSTADQDERYLTAIKNATGFNTLLKTGFIIHSLGFPYADNPAANFKLLHKAAEKLHFMLIHVSLAASQIRDREYLIDSEERLREIQQLRAIQNVSEREYDHMSIEEQTKVDGTTGLLKIKLQEFEKRKAERTETEASLKLIQRKNEEEKLGKRKTDKIVRKDRPESARKDMISDTDDFRFLHESTLVEYQKYSSGIGTLVNYVREISAKSAATKLSQSGEKKPAKTKQSSLSVNLVEPKAEQEGHLSISYKEITASEPETATFQAVLEVLPPPPNISHHGEFSGSQAMILEQRILAAQPNKRSKQIFSLHTISDEFSELPTKGEARRPKTRGGEDWKLGNTDDESRVQKMRWSISPRDKVIVGVRFTSNCVGHFEDNLLFGIVGSTDTWSLNCAAICAYPTLAEEIIGTMRKSSESPRPPVSIANIAANESYVRSFDFGPLICNKSREKSIDSKATIHLSNNSKQEIQFLTAWKSDTKSEAFHLEQTVPSIPANSKVALTVYPCPKSAGKMEDTLICAIKDNPQCLLFNFTCHGVKPELEVDKKQIQFDKVVTGKTETREFKLHNPTELPIVWKITGTDTLPDDLHISKVEGVLEARHYDTVVASFMATKAISFKKSLRLEVCDFEKPTQVIQTEVINVVGEAFEVSVEFYGSKGSEILDFGVSKVGEESKQNVYLKNKSKYDVSYKISLEGQDSGNFSCIPAQGVLAPSEKASNLVVAFKSTKEVIMTDQLLMKCSILEVSGNELIQTLILRASVKSLLSRFTIAPSEELDFGAGLVSTRISKSVTIENAGEFEFRFNIIQPPNLVVDHHENKMTTKSRASSVGKLNKPGSPPAVGRHPKKDSKMTGSCNAGPFLISPSTGIIAVGTKQQIQVEFGSDNVGIFNEKVVFEMSDRLNAEPTETRLFALQGQCCVPEIVTDDWNLIFEDCEVSKRFKDSRDVGFAEQERAFSFGALLIGQQSTSTFRLINRSKVSCDVVINIKAKMKQLKADQTEVPFSVDNSRVNIPPFEHRTIGVTFAPQSLSTGSARLEAMIENSPDEDKLEFDLRGEGTLPRVIIHPSQHTSEMSGVLLFDFGRVLVGDEKSLLFEIENDGILPAKIEIDWSAMAGSRITCKQAQNNYMIPMHESIQFEMLYQPDTVHQEEVEITVKVKNNPFEDIRILFRAEAFHTDVTMEDLPEGGQGVIRMPHCSVGKNMAIFKLRNQTPEMIRFAWIEEAEVQLTPMISMIQPHGSQSITLSFTAAVPRVIGPLQLRYTNQKVRDVSTRQLLATTPRQSRAQLNSSVVLNEAENESMKPEASSSIEFFANADYAVCSLETAEVVFKPTLLYMMRAHTLSLKNTGRVRLRYNCQIYNPDGSMLKSSASPYTIIPQAGDVLPGQTGLIQLNFEPTRAEEYSNLMRFEIENLAPDQKSPYCTISASSVVPICHFEPNTDKVLIDEYRIVEKSLLNHPSAGVEPHTKYLFFESRCQKNKISKKFTIMNPTDISWDFKWSCTQSTAPKEAFRCLTESGSIASGKKLECVFEFLPIAPDISESIWRFSIPSRNVYLDALLVGVVVEPQISFDRNLVAFKPTFIGRFTKELVVLVNKEEIPLQFAFEDSLKFAEGSVVSAHPASGVVRPKSELPVEIRFQPVDENVFRHLLVCHVKKKSQPLRLQLRGEGVGSAEALSYIRHDGQKVDWSLNTDNNLHFGRVFLNAVQDCVVSITNEGKTAFDYKWVWSKPIPTIIKIQGEAGTLQPGETKICKFSLISSAVMTLSNMQVTCQLSTGKQYRVSLTGNVAKPLIRLNALAIDFGAIFASQNKSIVKKLTITNDDIYPVHVQASRVTSEVFQAENFPLDLAPKEAKEFSIAFTPTGSKSFSGELTLLAEGVHCAVIKLNGEGAEYRVEVASVDSAVIDFGALMVGQSVIRTAKVVNKSIIPITISLGDMTARERLAQNCLSISPVEEITLKAKASAVVEIKFAPNRRLAPFVEELTALGIQSSKLCKIQGSSKGTHIVFSNSGLSFGPVCIETKVTKTLQMKNDGNAGAKFSWQVTAPFEIQPTEGSIGAGGEIMLQITFKPTTASTEPQKQYPVCSLDGGEKITLSLSGTSMTPSTAVPEVVRFTTPVRQSDAKIISVQDKSSITASIRANIDGEWWHGPRFINAVSGHPITYELIYSPLEMTTETNKHEGTLTLTFPDGLQSTWKLFGTSTAPLSLPPINRDISSKQMHSELLTVQNWLPVFQKFKAIIEVAKPDPTLILKGSETINVAGSSASDYKLSVYAYREGSWVVRMIFASETTGEHILYTLNLRAASTAVSGTFSLTATVRETVIHQVNIENVFTLPATLQVTASCAELTVPGSVTIPPK